MRVLIAFDKFKDALTAEAACGIAAEAVRHAQPGWTVETCPLADGGEGFASILTTAAGGELRAVNVTGPRGKPVRAAFGLVPTTRIPPAARSHLTSPPPPTGAVAVIEMAAASGLALLDPAERDVWQTSTGGTGELLRSAAESGAHAIVLGVGGSATNDLGLGALSVLGLKIEAADGPLLRAPVPAEWSRIARLTGNIRALPPLFIACDVTNPLLGRTGAAAVYGPQKGLRPGDIARLDHAAARLALMLCNHFAQPDAVMERPGAGAAGGIAFGLMVAAGASLLPGFDLVADWLDLDARIARADIVITGEGRFDESSLTGKGPGAVAARALSAGKPVHVFAGAVTARGSHSGLKLHAISKPATPLSQALRESPANIASAIREAFK